MSGKANKASEGAVSKVKVKRQIKTIVEDLETILGDLKDVAKEIKEVVQEIDTLTSDLQLEEDMTDSSKTDTLNSSSSSTATTNTTASSIDKIKLRHGDLCPRPASIYPTVLTVLKKPHPPLPPPRLTPVKAEDHGQGQLSGISGKAAGAPLQNGIFPGIQINRDSQYHVPKITEKKSGAGAELTPLLRHEKSRCPQVTRERVRFSEKVQYHGYCPDCDLQYDVQNEDLSLECELADTHLSPSHTCSGRTLENGGPGVAHGYPHTKPPYVPHSINPKPQKTILRKTTTTTV